MLFIKIIVIFVVAIILLLIIINPSDKCTNQVQELQQEMNRAKATQMGDSFITDNERTSIQDHADNILINCPDSKLDVDKIISENLK